MCVESLNKFLFFHQYVPKNKDVLEGAKSQNKYNFKL